MKLFLNNCWLFKIALLCFGCVALSEAESGKSLKMADRIIVVCEEKVQVNPDNIMLNIRIINISSDTLVFPVYRLPKSPWFDLTILEVKVCCGIHSQIIRPKPSNNPMPCYPSSDDQNFVLIAKGDTISLSYELSEIGYFPLDGFQLNREYTYFVEIEIPDYEVDICSNMWTGSIRSNLGSFIIK